MGHFDATDPITRTPIHEGDEVLMVCLYPYPYKYLGATEPTTISMRDRAHVYELLDLIYLRDFEENQELNRHEGVLVARGKYSGYSWLDGSDLQNHPAKSKPRDEVFKFFVHIEVLEWLGIDVSSSRNMDELLVEVLQFAISTRTQLFHHNLLGEQDGHCSKEERDQHARLVQVMTKAHEEHYVCD